jgi:hypothetical protein
MKISKVKGSLFDDRFSVELLQLADSVLCLLASGWHRMLENSDGDKRSSVKWIKRKKLSNRRVLLL